MTTRTYGVALERTAPLRLPVHPVARNQRWQRWAKQQARPRAIDLFSGCGGLSLGLEEAGYAVVLSIDNDPWALETHRHNLPGSALDLDLSEPGRIDSLCRLLDGISIDLIAGGPPCQPFSRAGRSKIRSLVEDGTRPEEDDRQQLWQSFLKIVERLKPAAVLMENVPDMALGDDLAILRELSGRLEEAGYDVHARLLDAWRYGVPQHRQRLILAGLRDGQSFDWPAEQKRITLREAIGDLPRLGGGTGDREMPARRPTTPFQVRARAAMNGSKVVWDHLTRPVREDDREAFRLMNPGTRYGELPEHLRRYRDDIFRDKYNRLPWDDLSRSITAHLAKDGYWYIHPEEQRTLTVREAARIQTFPDHFRFAGTRSHAFRQIGNAVPPALAEAVGKSLLRAVRRRAPPRKQRSTAALAETRVRLLEWARSDSKRSPWRHPGDPWQVLAGVVLGDRIGADDDAVRQFLDTHPAPGRRQYEAIKKEARRLDGTAQKDLSRLASAARAIGGAKNAWTTLGWAKAAALGALEETLVRIIGLGEERIPTSAPSLRVAARLAGRRVNEERRMSDGRMAVARLVGTGPSTPALVAAVHALGRAVCTADQPSCRACPVKQLCLST